METETKIRQLTEHIENLTKAGNEMAREAFQRGAISCVEKWDEVVMASPIPRLPSIDPMHL